MLCHGGTIIVFKILEDEGFFRNGIQMLPDRWDKVVANGGQNFE